jgi:phosphoglycerate dehydrogenase-like enzyme
LNGHRLLYDPDLWRRPEDLERLIAAASALVVRNATPVTRRLVERAPALRVVGRLGTGLDNIDTEALNERGIRLLWAPGANAGAVAEYVILALLLASRPLDQWAAETRQGFWRRTPGEQVAGRTVAVLGYGHVGREVGARVLALGLRVRVFDRHPPPALDPRAQFFASPLAAVQGAHFLTIHLPLTGETERLVNQAVLERLAPGAYVINTSRGAIVDEEALLAALDQGHLAGAILDVRRTEPPPPDDRLLQHPRVRHTPHVAGLTHSSAREIAEIVLKGVATLLDVSPA